ncbi:hypothetical protein CEXT_729281, partial [Caerostris extrusa]
MSLMLNITLIPKWTSILWTKNVRIVMHLNSKMSQPDCVAHQEKGNYRKLKHHLKTIETSEAETNKNASSKDYYAYRLMIGGRGQDNDILRCRELCQQFMVESERLRYLRHNQQKL